MAKTITTRLPDKFVKGIQEIAKQEQLDTSATIRKLLAQAISEWKIDFALKQYAKGKISLEQTANCAQLSIWEVPALLKKNKIPINIDEEELTADMETIKWKKE